MVTVPEAPWYANALDVVLHPRILAAITDILDTHADGADDHVGGA